MSIALKAPFPYFGGKSSVAALVWERLGNVSHYIEPFAGSLAVLLGRPHKTRPGGGPLCETVNDLDGLLSNFWRSMSLRPSEVEAHALGPVFELDLHARHAWLIERANGIAERLRADPEWCDPKAAGWWVWGLGAWVGSGWGTREARQLPQMWRGVHSDSGAGRLRALIPRLSRLRVLCGDWQRTLTESATTRSSSSVGVFLDPPYGHGSMEYAAGGNADDTLDAAVWAWATQAGEVEHMRICIAGYDDRSLPAGWTSVAWKARGGFGLQSNSEARANRSRERLWFSPHCLKLPAQLSLLGCANV